MHETPTLRTCLCPASVALPVGLIDDLEAVGPFPYSSRIGPVALCPAGSAGQGAADPPNSIGIAVVVAPGSR